MVDECDIDSRCSSIDWMTSAVSAGSQRSAYLSNRSMDSYLSACTSCSMYSSSSSSLDCCKRSTAY